MRRSRLFTRGDVGEYRDGPVNARMEVLNLESSVLGKALGGPPVCSHQNTPAGLTAYQILPF